MKLKQLLFALTFLFGFGIASLAQMTSVKKAKNDVLFVICSELEEVELTEEQMNRIDPDNFIFLSFGEVEGYKSNVLKVKMKDQESIEDLDPDQIESISVYKDQETLEKYKAQEVRGIVEIYLKSEKKFWHLITQ